MSNVERHWSGRELSAEEKALRANETPEQKVGREEAEVAERKAAGK